MIIIVMLAACGILVGISYLMLYILSGIVLAPKTPVREVAGEGELILPLQEKRVTCMQISADGRFMAFITTENEGAEAVLRVVELTRNREEIQKRGIRGEKLAWLGESGMLIYEDQGDIQVADVLQGTITNLTDSIDYDRDPLPSPDGRYILWTRSPAGEESREAELWMMHNDGSNQAYMAPLADLVTWDPVGGRLVSRQESVYSYEDDGYRDVLQMAMPGKAGWSYYAECDGEVRYVWWPLQDELLYVSPQSIKDQQTFKGVWYWVKDPTALKKVASTEGLSDDQTYYRFYPSRVQACLAYVGEKGLEYLDYEERVIYRYTDLEVAAPLAWNESAGEIYYLGPEGICKVMAEGG